jgi:hypothetical protein
MANTDSFSERMRKLTMSARGEYNSFKEFKNAADIKQFFKSEVAKNAHTKIEGCAAKGHFTAEVLEYCYHEYFYVTANGNVVRVPKFEKVQGAFLHRIHHVIHTTEFKTLMENFLKELGDMRVMYKQVTHTSNVIIISWGGMKKDDDTAAESAATDAPSEEKSSSS